MQKTQPRHPFLVRVGQRLRELRTEKGYSLEETAAAAGFRNTNVLEEVEQGDALPTFHTLNRFASALDVDPLDLVNFSERSLRNQLAEATRNLSEAEIAALWESARMLQRERTAAVADAEEE